MTQRRGSARAPLSGVEERPPLVVRRLGRRGCGVVADAMRGHTLARTGSSADEVWLVEHDPVFTLGQAGRSEHVLAAGEIPVLRVDRGGQVTYHGPGQLVVYLLLDLRRRGLGVRRLVSAMEQAVIDLLQTHGVDGRRRAGAPGVYVSGKKIAALGLRVRRGCCYHGLAMNVNMDLSPFERIDPCGFAGLEVTQLHEVGIPLSVRGAGDQLLGHLARRLGYAPPASRCENRLPR